MRRDTKTVWYSDNDQELLQMKAPGQFYIPLSAVNEALLRELGKAINDALSDELVQAMNRAKERK